MNYRLKAITRDEHLAFVAAQPSVSHMQVPAWADVKPDWRGRAWAGSTTAANLLAPGWCCFGRCRS